MDNTPTATETMHMYIYIYTYIKYLRLFVVRRLDSWNNYMDSILECGYAMWFFNGLQQSYLEIFKKHAILIYSWYIAQYTCSYGGFKMP